MEHFIVGAELMIWMRERDAEQGNDRNRIENLCFRTLILKLVNPLELLEDRIAIHIWIDFYKHP